MPHKGLRFPSYSSASSLRPANHRRPNATSQMNSRVSCNTSETIVTQNTRRIPLAQFKTHSWTFVTVYSSEKPIPAVNVSVEHCRSAWRPEGRSVSAGNSSVIVMHVRGLGGTKGLRGSGRCPKAASALCRGRTRPGHRDLSLRSRASHRSPHRTSDPLSVVA